MEILNSKIKLDRKNKYIWNNKEFIKHRLWVVKTKFKKFIQNTKKTIGKTKTFEKLQLKDSNTK